MGFTYWIVVGLIAGWLAVQVMKGGAEGMEWWLTSLFSGFGGIVGGFVFGLLGLHAGGLIGQIVVAFAGPVILVWITRKVKKA